MTRLTATTRFFTFQIVIRATGVSSVTHIRAGQSSVIQGAAE